MTLSILGALALTASLVPQEQPRTTGFEPFGEDPYTSGLFEQLTVTPGPPARALAQILHGETERGPFVNVLRMTDARRYRGQLITVRLQVRLDAPTVDTTARLWVRTQDAQGRLRYDDHGLDAATSSSEWTSLSSTFAAGTDATDLWFGLVVEGPTQVHFQEFAVEVHGDVAGHDVRHAVPARWASHSSVRNESLASDELGLDVRVTSFHPPGHDARELPQLVVVRADNDLRRSYAAGRALLEGMRLGQDPPAVVRIVQPAAGSPAPTSAGAAALLALLGRLDAQQAPASAPVVALLDGSNAPPSLLTPTGIADALPESALRAIDERGTAGGELLNERVLLRIAASRHDARGDADLAELLLDATLTGLEPWSSDAVRLVSHSLTGHQCDHDHGHDHSHDH
ncbi:MAG: hypothetical protein AAFP22_13190 [Planctomycetota bacterium]